MAKSAGSISGVAVALAGAGALLLYAGLRGVPPIEALRSIASGKAPPKVESKVPPLTTGSGGGGPSSPDPGPGTTGSALVAAAYKHRTEKYSQPKRWQVGYSDCSSFVGKALKDIGIKPPGVSVVGSYFSPIGTHWKGIHRIDAAQVGAGDLVIAVGAHMIIATGNATGIGQQNRRRNVQTGPIKSLMAGTGSRLSYWRLGATPPELPGG